MPTILSHSVIAVAASLGFSVEKKPWKPMILGILCSVLPDADVIGYQWLYIPYGSFFGHRGFFHSPFFAALLSAVVVLIFFRQPEDASRQWRLFFYFFVLGASHGVLDALTNGGQGIALLSPVSNHRYFFPWTPIEVSPLGVKAFLSQRGLAVLKNEVAWIWIPSCMAAFSVLLVKRHRRY